MPKHGISKQRLAFCRAYVKLRNIEKAALEAGYSEVFARKKAHSLLDNDEVRAEISKLTKQVEARTVKTAADVLDMFSLVAFHDPLSFLKPDDMYPDQWTYKSPDELTEEQRKVVKRVHIHKHFNEETGGFIRETYSYTFKDSERALDQMGRHFGLFDDQLRLVGNKENPLAGLSTDRVIQIKQAIANVMQQPAALIEDGELIDERKRNGSA